MPRESRTLVSSIKTSCFVLYLGEQVNQLPDLVRQHRFARNLVHPDPLYHSSPEIRLCCTNASLYPNTSGHISLKRRYPVSSGWRLSIKHRLNPFPLYAPVNGSPDGVFRALHGEMPVQLYSPDPPPWARRTKFSFQRNPCNRAVKTATIPTSIPYRIHLSP